MATKKTTQKTTTRRGLLGRLLVIALVLFVFIEAVQLYAQLEKKRLALSELEVQMQTQSVINEGLNDQVNNADDYFEHKANEDGYYMPGQQIYQNEAG